MGSALAERLVAGGRRVVGYDRRDAARDRLGAIGGEPVTSVGEVFASARVVLLSLPESEVVRAVIDEAGESIRGARIIDTTTGDPEASAALGPELSGRGAQY